MQKELQVQQDKGATGRLSEGEKLSAHGKKNNWKLNVRLNDP